MISTSGKSFADFQNRLDARIATIVKITYGDDVWYLGDREIEWGGGVHVYALLTSCTGMKRAIDPFRKKWSVGEVTLSFSNLPFKKDSNGNWLRPSDDINAVETNPVEIYLLCGENATGLSDCILGFSGLLKEPAKFDENTWSITIVDRSISLMNQMLPSAIVGSVFSDAPDKYKNDSIPLAYGTFKWPYQSGPGGSGAIGPVSDEIGLTRGIPIDRNFPPKCVYSDHAVKSFSQFFYQPSGIDSPGEFNNLYTTRNINDGGYCTSVLSGNVIRVMISPDTTNKAGYSFQNEEDPTNVLLACNKNANDYATIKDNVSDDGYLTTGEGRWGFTFDPHVASALKAINPDIAAIDWDISYKAIKAPAATGVTGQIYLYYKSGDTRYPLGGEQVMNLNNDWHNHHFIYPQIVDDKDRQYLVAVRTVAEGDGNGSLNDFDILRVYEVYMSLIGLMPQLDYLWGAIEGRTFGSWIDYRSVPFLPGDLIEDPAYIIESLLRDELNWATANIDEASFDASYNLLVVMRMNLTKQATAANIIRQICEQSTFAFHVNSAGKARLIPLNESGPSTDRTIPFSHVKANTLRTSQIGPFVNWLTYNSCWLPQLGKYRDIDKNYDLGSLQIYGIHEQIVYWPNIEGDSVNHIFQHLVSSSGLWSRPRRVIEFETVKFTNADIEIGDWIELDDDTWDAQLKQVGGASWSGGQFLVTEVTQKQDGTRIKAIAI